MASSETRMNKAREKEEAIANGVKLRALQASLMQMKSSPSSNYSLRNPSSSSAASPASRPLPNLSAHDYPVFTPVTLSLSLFSLFPLIILLGSMSLFSFSCVSLD